MGLCDLPDDVLFLIVHQTCVFQFTVMREKLRLLAVCRRLRLLALPVVYEKAYDRMFIDDLSLFYRDTQCYTNVGLVSPVGYLHLVRRVDISLRRGIDPLYRLRMTALRLRAAGEQWDAVHTLHILVGARLDRDMDLDEIACEAQEIAAMLTATLPGVQQLILNNQVYNRAFDKIGGILAAHYADQLRTLHGGCIVATAPGAVFRGLRDANFGYRNRRDCRRLRIDPAELQSLRLERWRSDHSWAGFSIDGDESQDIWFPSLRELDLSTYWEAAADGTDETEPRGRLHFPALKVLKVECGNGILHVLERGVFPARLDLVVVLVAASAVLDILNMVVPNARHFRLILRCDADYDPAKAAAAQRMLDRARDCDEVELRIDGQTLPTQPETLASALVTRLFVSMDIDLGNIVALVRCLPRLSSLAIKSLNARNIPAGISIPEPGADRLVEPISSTLKHVCISFDCNWLLNPEAIVFALKYLLLAVPSLSTFKAYGILDDPMDVFVGSYVGQYPHLARLRHHTSTY